MAQILLTTEGATPSAPGVGQISLYGKLDGRLYVQDSGSTEVQILTNETALSDLFVQAPITKSGPTSSPTIGIGLANASNDGAMSSGDFTKLFNSTNLNNPSTLVSRDASGNFAAGTITANLSGNATTCTTIPALVGHVVSSGSSNNTTISTGVITNAMINASAGIALSKLATDPLNRTNHSGTQLAATISDFTATVESLFGNPTFDANVLSGLSNQITNTQIATAANIALSKLATDPLARANHSGTQLAATISDFTTAVDTQIPLYLASNPITNSDIDASAAIALSKLATDPLARAGHTGTQLASTISDFTTAAQGAFTQGNGIDITAGTISAAGVAGQIDVSGAGIGIDSTYSGQNTITTLGTVTTGTWNASVVPVLYGGTGAASATIAAKNLRAISTISSTQSISDVTEQIIQVDTSGGTVALNLPTASSSNKVEFRIKKTTAANTVDITPNGADEIDGSNSALSLTAQYASITIYSDGVAWWISSRYLT